MIDIDDDLLARAAMNYHDKDVHRAAGRVSQCRAPNITGWAENATGTQDEALVNARGDGFTREHA